MLSKKTTLAISVLALVGFVSILGINAKGIKAAETKTDPFSGIVQAVAQKFNLDQAQVKTVVDDYQTQQRADMEAKMAADQENRLTQAVTDGKITADQKQKIIDERNQIKSWSSSTGIDTSYLMMGMGGHVRPGGPPPAQ